MSTKQHVLEARRSTRTGAARKPASVTTVCQVVTAATIAERHGPGTRLPRRARCAPRGRRGRSAGRRCAPCDGPPPVHHVVHEVGGAAGEAEGREGEQGDRRPSPGRSVSPANTSPLEDEHVLDPLAGPHRLEDEAARCSCDARRRLWPPGQISWPCLEAPADRAPHALPQLHARLGTRARPRAFSTLQAIVLFISLSTWMLLLVEAGALDRRVHASATSLATEGSRIRSCATSQAELRLEQVLHRVHDLVHRVGTLVRDPVGLAGRALDWRPQAAGRARCCPRRTCCAATRRRPTIGALPSRIIRKNSLWRGGCSGP